MRELPPVARVYLVLSYLLGLGALGCLLFGGADPVRLGDLFLGVPLAALAAGARVFVVKRARGDHSDHLTPAPLFAAFLLLPHPLLALAVVFAFVPEWVYYRRQWFIQCFNIASWLIALAGAKVALFALGGRFRLEDEWSLPALAVLVAMGVFLGLQTFVLAWALKLASGTPCGRAASSPPASCLWRRPCCARAGRSPSPGWPTRSTAWPLPSPWP